MTKKLCLVLVFVMMLSVFALPVSVTAATIETPTDVPKIIINTQNSTTPNRDSYITCSIKIIDEQGGTYETIYDTASSIKVRGNSTSLGEKKPFNIKFSAKYDVLGMGASKKWALLSNCYEKTLIRNKAVLDFANNTKLQYTSQSKYADLYLNGRYLGSYQITESVETGSTRVDIDTGANDILMEVESFRTETGITYITTSRYGNRFAFNEPEVPTAAQQSYLTNLFKNAETAMASKKFSEIEKYFDIDTMVDFYIINEFFKSVDVYKSSTRLYVKDGKIYGGPLWDFDLSSGNINKSFDSGYYNNGKSWENIFAGSAWDGGSFDWFFYLLQCSDFKQLVIQRFDELTLNFENLYRDNALGTNYIDRMLAEYGDHFNRNYSDAGWSLTKTYSTVIEGIPYERTPDSTYAANVEYLRTWYQNRHEWLREYWGLSAITPSVPEIKPEGTKINAKGCKVTSPYGDITSSNALGANLTDGIFADGSDLGNNNWFAFIKGENAIPYAGSSSGRTQTGVVIIDLGEEYNITGYRVHHLGIHPDGSLLPHSLFINASNNPDGGYKNVSDEGYVGTSEANSGADIWNTVTTNAYWSGRYDLNFTGRYVAIDVRFYDKAYINEIELYGTPTAEGDNGNTDSGNTDNGNTDSGNTDNGNTDNGNTDNGNTDNGNTDNGNTDAVVIGDVDNNGVIDADDYITLKRIYFGTASIEGLNEPETAASRCDVNQDGKIDADDYITLKRVYFGTASI